MDFAAYSEGKDANLALEVVSEFSKKQKSNIINCKKNLLNEEIFFVKLMSIFFFGLNEIFRPALRGNRFLWVNIN